MVITDGDCDELSGSGPGLPLGLSRSSPICSLAMNGLVLPGE